MKSDRDAIGFKRGYLKRDFEFFHLKDQRDMQFEFHYHDFHKILVFISGKVTYLIEGRAYRLRPWDIILVGNNEVHKPIIETGEIYERMVLWINPLFLDEHSTGECKLESCFEAALEAKCNLIRLDPEFLMKIRMALSQLEEAFKDEAFGAHILRNSILMQLVVYLNRKFLGTGKKKEQHDIEYDENINRVLSYINDNLHGDLSIDALAARFFTSKYYLMRKFKKHTGYSVHNYILQKRLIQASSMIKNGRQVTEAVVECGFGDYSNFMRLFKKVYGMPPKQYYKNHFMHL